MYLELAENNNKGYYSMMAQAGDTDPSGLYMYIPAHLSATGEGMYVREDSFDMLPDFEWAQLQDVLEPYQEKNLSLFGLGKKARARRAERRAARRARKVARFEARTGRRESLATIRGDAGGGALGMVGETISNIFGGGQAEPLPMAPEQLPPAKPTLMGMPIWVPVVVGGGILVTILMAQKGKGK